MNKYIGIDLGTSSVKMLLVSADGSIEKSVSREYPISYPQSGWSEQNPTDWYNATIDGLYELLDGCDKDTVKGISFGGQMHGLVMLDEKGNVLRPSIIWCDQRTARECDEITERVGRERLIEITANPALTGFTASKILWVRNNEPEIYEKCRHILLPKDYIRYKLTGAFATDVSDASGMQLLDIAKRDFSSEVLSALSIDRDMLARVYESPEITGYISKEAALLTGLSEKTAVVAGAGDNAAAAIASGVVEDGLAFTTVGTSGVVFAHTREMKIDKKGRVHTFCAAVPGEWHVMGVTQSAGLSLRWFKDNFCKDLSLAAEEMGKDVYELIDSEAESSPIGADKLLYLPYLMGERTPHLDADCRGVFFGLSAKHNRADTSRAVLEGVAYSLKDCLSVLSEIDVSPDEMILTGGGARSGLWRRILCDVFALPTRELASSEGPALGGAILASVGAGVYPDVRSACSAMVKKKDETNYPIEENSERYAAMYSLYRKLYPALKDSFSELSRL